MCGIVGYVGNRKVVPILLDGLRRLEYRGYDSAGLAVVNGDGELVVRRAKGKLRNLEEALRENPIDGIFGIGHTRWATHGRPTEENAHPHRSGSGDVVVVHNGIIENYLALKEALLADGHQFQSETDTEVIAHLIDKHYNGSLEHAVVKAVHEMRGVFALGIISRREPKKIIGVRSGPPAVVGLGENEYFLASDVPAILGHTRDIIFLADGDIAVITPEGVTLCDFDGHPVKREVSHILWDPIMAEKGGFKHFMLKEIYEQPRSVRDTLIGRVGQESGRVFTAEMDLSPEELKAFEHIKIVACGTSWHAALAGKFMIENLARVPVEVDYGSEFRYRNPILTDRDLTVLISQSGETADTLAAQREVKRRGGKTVAICNVVGSMLTREANGNLMTHAGPEIGVASTKAFTAQLMALFLLAMRLGQARGTLKESDSRKLVQELLLIPGKLEAILSEDAIYDELTPQLLRAQRFPFPGPGHSLPDRARRRAQVEGDLLHPRGGLSGRRDEARPECVDRREPARSCHRHA